MDYTKYTKYVPIEKMAIIDNKPSWIVVHCSDSDFDNFESIQRFHITDPSHHWENIGYHYVVERDGTLRYGRPENYHGAHVGEQGMNTKSLGICLCGKFENKGPSDAQVATLKKLLGQLTVKYGITKDKVVPHRHFTKAKTCYGSFMKDDWAQSLLEVSEDWKGRALIAEKKIEAIKTLANA